jgi:hypothetical protein
MKEEDCVGFLSIMNESKYYGYHNCWRTDHHWLLAQLREPTEAPELPDELVTAGV